jgi:heptosyltransferase II
MPVAAPDSIPIPAFEPEGIVGVRRTSEADPERLVLVRLQAFGDATGILPVIGALKERWPSCRLEVVTDVRSAALFAARSDVSRVHAFDARARRIGRALSVFRVARAIREEPLDALLDLQRSSLSLSINRRVKPPAWVSFDRFAPKNGLTRYLDAVEWVGLGALPPLFEPRIKPGPVARARALLADSGLSETRPLVCLNPAGGWETKQWALARWIELGRQLAAAGVGLIAIGDGALLPRFGALKEALGPSLVDFSGRTSPDLAMALLAQVSLIVSEDSGLMHLGWVQGVPAIALFGATRSAWSRPIGPGCSGFYSEDLPCGACMQPICAREDLLCLTRVSVDDVLSRAAPVLSARVRRS